MCCWSLLAWTKTVHGQGRQQPAPAAAPHLSEAGITQAGHELAKQCYGLQLEGLKLDELSSDI
jgi:hypothetical protein